MLKKRIAAVLVIKDGIVVQSLGFQRYLPVGKPAIAIEFLNHWGIDEIIMLDISATRKGYGPDFSMVRKAGQQCRVPLTVGGGITNIAQIHDLMHCGADKVSLNQAGLSRFELLRDAARVFGDQCIVASIDASWTDSGYRVYDYKEGKTLPITPCDHAKRMRDAGAGEILINSVDRDGMKTGFDFDLINQICQVVTIPVIACGGAGGPQHLIDAIVNTSASAIAAANFFHFFEHSVTITKAQTRLNHPIRHETHAKYEDNQFDKCGRPLKKDDQVLESLLYLKIEKEVI